MTAALTEAIRMGLREAADSSQAPAMAAYMKNVQPFLGIKTPARNAVLKPLLRVHFQREERLKAALELWEGDFREERYAAQDILAASKPMVKDLPLLEGMLPGCDWWDLLDSQIGLIGRTLIPYPELRRERVHAWQQSEHLWTRRAAVLAQLHAKGQTDSELLYETVSVLMFEKEFFIQKAIGWALREYAKTDAKWVQRAVVELNLSGLARREALRHLHTS